jgi:hypothetical protein
MDGINKKVNEIVEFLDEQTEGKEFGDMDALKVFLISLISEYLQRYDYYSVLGFLDDLKGEWTRLNIDKVEEKEMKDNEQN